MKRKTKRITITIKVGPTLFFGGMAMAIGFGVAHATLPSIAGVLFAVAGLTICVRGI